MLTPGTLLDERYEIIEKIGAGGMSIVYKAKDNRLQRNVAIKELREEFAKDDEFVNKFRKEALSAARLSHPNIVGIYDVGNDQDIHYIVMEYVEGKTLKQVIEEKGPFDYKTVLEYGTQIVSALKHAHEKKIIHRDIKPQNILMTKDGILKVTDFGIAKAVDSSTVVATGNAIGSVHYFSPEQAKGKYVNESSDLYSCGIVLFELATKRLPFEAESHVSIALKHISEEFPKPSKFNNSIPQSLEDLILKATAKNQIDRYQNASEMLHDMKAILIDPNYQIPKEAYSDKTILLSEEDTKLLREAEENNASPFAANKLYDNTLNAGDMNLNNEAEMSGVSYGATTSTNVQGTNNGIDNASNNNPYSVNRPQDNEQSIYNKNSGLDDEEDDDDASGFYKFIVGIGGMLLTLVLVAVIAFASVVWLPQLFGDKEIKVPNVINMKENEATTAITSKHLKLKVEYKEDNSKEDGLVVNQQPSAGEIVKRNDIVIITVIDSDGTAIKDKDDKEFALPSFEDEELDQAMEELDKLGLEVGDITYEYSSDVEEGKIISHKPSAGKKVKKGDKVDIVISKGEEPVVETKMEVPSLYGLTIDEARSKVYANELVFDENVAEEFSSDVEAGKVISQSIDAGVEVEKGTTISIVVSKGPEEVIEPSENPEENVENPSEDPGQNTVPTTAEYQLYLPGGLEERDSYHVVVVLTLEDGTTSYYEDNVAYNDFPKSISFTGYGVGDLEITVDEVSYHDAITF